LVGIIGIDAGEKPFRGRLGWLTMATPASAIVTSCARTEMFGFGLGPAGVTMFGLGLGPAITVDGFSDNPIKLRILSTP
jgi:hypothetical protein